MKRLLIICILIASLCGLTTVALAQGILDSPRTAWSGCKSTTTEKDKPICIAGEISLQECIKNGNCGIEHILILADSIITWAAGVAGAVALLMFVLGGMWMIFSAGDSGRVQRGKDILKGSTIALFWIFGSWLVVNFTVTALTKPNPDQIQITAPTCQGKSDGEKCGGTSLCYQQTCISGCSFYAKSTNQPWICATSLSSCGISVPSGTTDQQQCDQDQDQIFCKGKICANPEEFCCKQQ